MLGNFPGVVDATVYGVALPGHDGKAGAAAIFIDPGTRDRFDLGALLRYATPPHPRLAAGLNRANWTAQPLGTRGHTSQNTQCRCSSATWRRRPRRTTTSKTRRRSRRKAWTRPRSTRPTSSSGWLTLERATPTCPSRRRVGRHSRRGRLGFDRMVVWRGPGD